MHPSMQQFSDRSCKIIEICDCFLLHKGKRFCQIELWKAIYFSIDWQHSCGYLFFGGKGGERFVSFGELGILKCFISHSKLSAAM